MLLSKSSQFQTEFKNFTDRIGRITDPNVKKEIEGDLRSLVNEVTLLDQLHQDLLFQKNLSGSAGDSKIKILDTRRKITKKLDSWEKITRSN